MRRRACNRPARRCTGNSGPGVTNAVTGIATAYMDLIPIVIITGQVPTHAIGQDAFKSATPLESRGLCEAQLPGQGRWRPGGDDQKAFYIATTGRPGPVVVGHGMCRSRRRRIRIRPPSRCAPIGPLQKARRSNKKAMQMLLEAERPMIYVGGGAVIGNASNEVSSWCVFWATRATTRSWVGIVSGLDNPIPGMLWYARHL